MKTFHARSTACFSLSAPLIRAPPLVSGFCKAQDLHISDCSRTMRGTHKDFRSSALLEQYGQMNPIFYSITMGNAGYSLGALSRGYNERTGAMVRVVNVVDRKLSPEIRAALESVSIVLSADLRDKILRPGELLALVANSVAERGLFIHAENGHFAYRHLVEGVLGENPEHVVLPLGSGELFYNFLLGMSASAAAGLPVPRVTAVTVRENLFSMEREGWNPEGTSAADKLVSPTSIYYDWITAQLGNFNARIVTVGDEEIMEAFRVLIRAGIRSEPSAAAAFAGLNKAEIKKDGKIIVVNTGYGLYH